jgi:DNA-directed RNA polymerase sigma subunit (sigma70/sigma32)
MAKEYINNKTFEAIIDAFQGFKRAKMRYELKLADVKETYQRRKKKYNDEERLGLMIEAESEYCRICGSYKDYQEQLTYAFYILSEKIANYYGRYNGIDSEDAIQEGVLICFEKIDRFDHRKGKAFNYMTTCILNHYRQLYRSIKNYNELKRKYLNHLQERFESEILRGGSIGRSRTFDVPVEGHIDKWS